MLHLGRLRIILFLRHQSSYFGVPKVGEYIFDAYLPDADMVVSSVYNSVLLYINSKRGPKIDHCSTP